MARTRHIKPGFFKNEELAECDPLARLLFAGLWTIADREGRLEDRPKRIKADLLPYDTADVDNLLTQLANSGFIQRYKAGSQSYIQISRFVEHQQPHYKEDASKIPAPEGHVDSAYVAFGVSEKDRQAIFDRDGRKCVECGSTEKLSLDHIIPRSKGGTDQPTNLQTLCGSCNSSKNNRIASDDNRPPLNKEVSSVQGQSNVGSTKVPNDTLDLDLELVLDLDLVNFPAATPQAASVEPQAPTRKTNPVPKPETKPKPKEKPPLEWPDSFDVNTLWLLVEDDQGYPPNWNYGRETLAVHALLSKHPQAIPDDFAAFIRYRWKCFRGDPNAQPTFSEVPANFTSWLENGKPEKPVNQKDKTNEPRKPTRMDRAVANIESEYAHPHLDEIQGFGVRGAYSGYQERNSHKRLEPPKTA